MVASEEDPSRQQGLQALEQGRYADAFALLRHFAQAGDVEVQAHLGGIMSSGLHLFPDSTAYNAWLTAASEGQHAAFARNPKPDVDQAMRWLQNASDHGIGPASHNLAMAYLSGGGTLAPEDRRAKVKELLVKARRQGFAFFGPEPGEEAYLQTLEGYAASQGVGMPWESRSGADPSAAVDRPSE